ncbi:uncharacterized protein RJT20DRAFT_36124 [Scheffersomyces xylosifermentans]|uniref:uncharacterized protein n=1 Tax=Scheffersomyces xylosifermentans TaxID=1304137 RepID=UPI00315CA7A9
MFRCLPRANARVTSPIRGLVQFQSRSLSQYYKNNQIYIHDSNSQYAYSLSPNPEAVVIGHSKVKHDVTPSTFVPNDEFLQLLHQTAKDKIHEDFSFIMEAGMNASTFMPIYDFREIPRYARIPEMENVFGYIQVGDNGKMIPGSYESNNLYRLCNGTSGLLKLSDFMYQELQKECELKGSKQI